MATIATTTQDTTADIKHDILNLVSQYGSHQPGGATKYFIVARVTQETLFKYLIQIILNLKLDVWFLYRKTSE